MTPSPSTPKSCCPKCQFFEHTMGGHSDTFGGAGDSDPCECNKCDGSCPCHQGLDGVITLKVLRESLELEKANESPSHTEGSWGEFKERLEVSLDKLFPKGWCEERGEAMILFADAVLLHKELLSSNTETLRGEMVGKVVEIVDEYFKGLIFLPFPEITHKRLLDKLVNGLTTPLPKRDK